MAHPHDIAESDGSLPVIPYRDLRISMRPLRLCKRGDLRRAANGSAVHDRPDNSLTYPIPTRRSGLSWSIQ